MNELTETEKAYLAGFFDGEGCINIGKHTPTSCKTVSHFLQVIIAQTDQEFLSGWCDKTGIGKVYEHKGISNIAKIKRSWHWRIHGAAAEELLTILLPYLDIKREQAEVALRFRETKKLPHPGARGTPPAIVALREEYKQRLHALKRQGDKTKHGPDYQRDVPCREELSGKAKDCEELLKCRQVPLFKDYDN